MNRNMIRFGLSALLMATIALADDQPTPATKEGKDAGPKTATVKRDTLDLTVSTGGTFEAVDSFELRIRPKSFQGDLIVVSAVAPGTSATKGQIILELDATQINRQLAAAENELANSTAAYEKAKADSTLGEAADVLAMKFQEDEVKDSEGNLEWWDKVDGKHMRQNAELAVQGARDNVGDQTDELEQLRKMYKSEELTNATADIVVKRALRALERSKIGMQMTESRAEKTLQNDYENARQRFVYAIEQQKQALDRLKAQQALNKVQRQTGLRGSELGLSSAQEKVNNLKADLDQFKIASPDSMTVLYGQLAGGNWTNSSPRVLRAGEKINAGQVIMTGYAPGKVRFVADVPESKLMLVQNGLKATITPAFAPGQIWRATAGDPARTASMKNNQWFFETVLELESPTARFVPGMKGSASIDPGVTEQVLVAPLSAISAGKAWKTDGEGKESQIDVVVGRSNGEMCEIKSGLNEGDIVLKDGKK